jgi:hypothetical protein
LSVPTRKQQTPAANTSLIGAILVAVLYPRWCNEFPEVSLQKLDLCQYEYWFLNLCTLSMLGRCPVRSLNWSTIASLHFVRQTQSD